MKRENYGPSIVDISSKAIIQREATASGIIRLKSETIRLIRRRKIEKGDPITTAKIAGVLAAKNTSGIIPLCHHIPITSIEIIDKLSEDRITVQATVKAIAKTGVEMESLTAVMTALLTIWDMVKQYEKDECGQYPTTTIQEVIVVQKIKKSEER